MKRSPLLVALLWMLGVFAALMVSGEWLSETGYSWIGLAVVALVAFAVSYDSERRRSKGLPSRLWSRFPNSPEKSAVAGALFTGMFMMLWGVALRQGVRHSAGIAGFMTVFFYLMNREDGYLERGVTVYPVRWLTVDRVLWAMVISVVLLVGIGALVWPDRITRDDLIFTAVVAVPLCAVAGGYGWWRKKERGKRMREAAGKSA